MNQMLEKSRPFFAENGEPPAERDIVVHAVMVYKRYRLLADTAIQCPIQ